MSKSKIKILKFLAKAAVSLAFLVLVIYKVEWNEVLGYFKEISIKAMLFFLALFLVSTYISGYKWQIIAKAKKFYFGVWDLSVIYLVGAFINNFMPSFLGGDTYRSYEIGKKSDNRYVEAASTVLIDRVTGFLAAMILVIVFSLLKIETVIKNPLLIAMNLLVLASFGIDIALVMVRKSSFWPVIRKYIPTPVLSVASEMRSFNTNKKTLYKAILWGIIFNIIGVAFLNYIIFISLGIHIGIIDYMSVIFLISIVSAVPLSINNIGIGEWAFITFFGVYGVDPSAVITVSIITRFLRMFASFLALPAYMKERQWKEKFLRIAKQSSGTVA